MLLLLAKAKATTGGKSAPGGGIYGDEVHLSNSELRGCYRWPRGVRHADPLSESGNVCAA